MTYIFITLGLIALYFIISAIKEGEAKQTIERERKVTNLKIANLHFDNLIANEKKRQEMMGEARKVFIQQLEKEEGVHKVNIDENTLTIILEGNVSTIQANNDAQVWIDTLIPSTGVDIVEIRNLDGFILGSAKRNENPTQGKPTAMDNSNVTLESTKSELDRDEQAKYSFKSMFYNFCFSPETAKGLLEDTETRENISAGLVMTIFEEEKLLVKILKIFLKKKFGFILGESNFNLYNINGFELFLYEERVTCKEDESYFEIIYHDIENTKNEDKDEMAVALQFILYCINNIPSAIFVLVYDPFLEQYALRQVLENGISMKLAFFDAIESAEHMDFLINHVQKKI